MVLKPMNKLMFVICVRIEWLDVSVWYVVRFDTKRGQVTRGNGGLGCHPVGQHPCWTPLRKSLHNLIILLDEGGEGFSPVLRAAPFSLLWQGLNSVRFHPIFFPFVLGPSR